METAAPSYNRVLRVHEKKMQTYDVIEGALENFNEALKVADSICPFGHDSLDVQDTLNYFRACCTNLSRSLNDHINQSVEDHIKAVGAFRYKELTEDKFATYKTHITEELEFSRAMRKNDEKEQEILQNKLDRLQKEYLSSCNKSFHQTNKENENYSVVE